ncbi:unnamed protein product [Effrenium voratum]|uniref:Uncharacterized protein n=1 Tax=Effrenium voratum TaxID=2562239 RepID=A0AA36JN81_9DINO|nr:unnamed protein product [Effrenium voratum]|mmetsp:Transcript_119639/g.284188  ORF Transcript_119639/g.284188 Transcript_119639/m.284188 type:complete len:440 (-) Transcript_119639:35-1354(-)|eukprot:CAMPEP_0181407832 /NCGR_PEP_ID=MMETSP1110-20121109/5982_1 /TAXON_ID=174948 /ORGANISM="Symbiodinium sp., Strain CCMP421" /LENGTH=439 /DNA_ID=CAMNT_0023530271 /DNA_START=28 /DNA_END=1347 /DNA_ORIENTATION=+
MKPNEALIWTLIVALCVADAAKVRHADEVQGNHSNQSGLEASALTKEEPPVTASTRQTNDTSLKSSAPMLNFLFMAYDRLPHKEVWEKFFQANKSGSDFRVLVHCKNATSCREDLANHSLFKLVETVETEYCFGLVSAMNELLREALAEGPGHRNDKFVFISDTTLPVKPFHLVQQQLAHDDRSHFCFFPGHWLEWPHSYGFLNFLSEFYPWHDVQSKQRMAAKHHQWMVLSRQHAEKAVQEDGMFPTLLKELKVNSGLPGTVSGCNDEFWHFNALYAGINVTGVSDTSLVHLEGMAGGDIKYDSDHLQGQCDTFVYWQSKNDGDGKEKQLGSLLEVDAFTHLSHKAGHPCEFTSLGSRSIRALRKSPFLFARKVMPQCTVSGQHRGKQFRDLADAFDTLVFSDEHLDDEDDSQLSLLAEQRAHDEERWLAQSFFSTFW